MVAKPVKSVLFVCLGNICRSPLAEGVFRAVLAERGILDDFTLDSAGTGGWHAGSAPDPRSIAIAAQHGIDITAQQARKVRPEDFTDFDLILGMDRSNVDDLKAAAPADARGRVHLFLDFAKEHAAPGEFPHEFLGRVREVPDPYYGGPDGFSNVYRMIREASEALATRLEPRTSAPVNDHASSTI